MTRWEDVARAGDGADYARAYADRFRQLAAAGEDIHGEAAFVAGLVPPPARVLDAGCGTGRIAVALVDQGYDVVGCDVDASMVEVARAEAPDLDWRVADLTTICLDETFDVVLLAGNVVPLLDEGTLPAVCSTLAAHCRTDGVVVCGFGTDPDHLPDGCPVTSLDTFLTAAGAAGLVERTRYGTWDADAWAAQDGYVVVVLGLVE